MKCLRYIVLLVSVLLVAACEQLSLPDTELILAKQGTVELTDNSAVIEIEFHPTAATIQTVIACYTGGLKKEMTHVKGLVYRVELKNLQSDTEYHVYYEVSNVFSTVVVTGNYSFKTAKKGEKPNPTVTPEYVDLGLPSGIKWATFNVGATQPEEYGDYFAWGETEPKELYDWSTYKWCDGSYNTLTKYNTDSEYGVVDNKKILESSDDVATANWGGNWRMPSVDEWNELLSHCSLKWEERNGVSGVALVSVQNGNSIFLPAAGVYHYDNGLVNLNVEGWYRTNSLDESRGTISLGFSYTGSLDWYANDRCFGQPVRPVYGSRAEETTVPTVVTSAVTQITETSAVVGGNVTSDGGASVTERGVVYSTNPNPVITNLSNTIRPCGSGAGEFTYTITGLQPATTYYVRAYARNDQGTAYGEEVSFTTETTLPTVVTSAVTQITETSAVVGGNVTSDGGASVTERGVVYSTTQNPTVANSKAASGSGTGAFTCNLTGLQSNTTYFVRAYAVNSKGTAYGDEVSFTTKEEVMATPEYVDLGLSVKWATFNVGATKPEDYGDYFAWGETEPKDVYYESTYKWCNGSGRLTKYCTDSYYGTIDNKTVLEAIDDVAAVKWGGNWRMPTVAELTELLEQCTLTWTTHNGVNGYKVTSNSNGNSIFLPAAGLRDTGSHNLIGIYGGYWSNTLNMGRVLGAYTVHCNSNGLIELDDFDRWYGLSVRPVCP